MTFTINNTEVTLKQTFRSLVMYEQMAGHSFNPTTTFDILLYFYAHILGSNKDVKLSFDEYMDWIAGCKVLVTSDSLGVHLALAMKKSVVVLFGSTSGEEIYYYGRGASIYPKFGNMLNEYQCVPCYNPTCKKEKHCMDFIDLDDIVENVKSFL